MRSPHRTVTLAAILLSIGSGVLSAQAQPAKFAFVNPQALFENAPGRRQAESTFTREAEGFRAELGRMGDALQAMITAYQKAEPTLTAAQKEQRQRAIGLKEDSLRGRQQQLEQVAASRQSELMAPIMESVRKVLEDIRQEDGYAMIFSSEPGASPILAADKNLDITDRVVARLRTMAATKVDTKTKAGAPTSTPSGVTRPRPPA